MRQQSVPMRKLQPNCPLLHDIAVPPYILMKAVQIERIGFTTLPSVAEAVLHCNVGSEYPQNLGRIFLSGIVFGLRRANETAVSAARSATTFVLVRQKRCSLSNYGALISS